MVGTRGFEPLTMGIGLAFIKCLLGHQSSLAFEQVAKVD
jgi:hypothetical protein